MSEQDGLICAVILDRTGAGAQDWLEQRSEIDPVICQTPLQEDVRPRALTVGEALLIILRGVNLNPGADPEDVVGVRVWLERDRIVTLRHRRLMAVNDLREALVATAGPKGPGEFLHRLADSLIERLGPVIGELDDRVDELEDEVLTAQSAELRTRLGEPPRGVLLAPPSGAPARRDVTAADGADQLAGPSA